jgi:hypothetical protein
MSLIFAARAQSAGADKRTFSQLCLLAFDATRDTCRNAFIDRLHRSPFARFPVVHLYSMLGVYRL